MKTAITKTRHASAEEFGKFPASLDRRPREPAFVTIDLWMLKSETLMRLLADSHRRKLADLAATIEAHLRERESRRVELVSLRR
jgi:hypothetical protein